MTAGRLRVAYLADLNPYARTLIRLNALRDGGAEVWDIGTAPPGDIGLGYHRHAWWDRVMLKLSVHRDLTQAGPRLLALARTQPLDVIWIDKGLTISACVLEQAKALSGAKVVAFSEDDMALRHNRSRKWLGALKFCDLVVTTKIANVEGRELEALGAPRVLYVVQTYDPKQHFPLALSDRERTEWEADVAFVGSYEFDRAHSLLALAEAGVSVRVWGNGWAGKVLHPNLQVEGRPAVNAGEKLDYSKALTSSKIVLGFLRKLNRDQHTSRSLEIPACGSMLLAERTPVHQALFNEGVEAEFFGSDEELIAKARYYLEHEDKRATLARAGHDRCVRDYSSARQMDLILKALGTHL